MTMRVRPIPSILVAEPAEALRTVAASQRKTSVECIRFANKIIAGRTAIAKGFLDRSDDGGNLHITVSLLQTHGTRWHAAQVNS